MAEVVQSSVDLNNLLHAEAGASLARLGKQYEQSIAVLNAIVNKKYDEIQNLEAHANKVLGE